MLARSKKASKFSKFINIISLFSDITVNWLARRQSLTTTLAGKTK